MTEREKIAIVQIANSIIPVAYICQPPLFPILISLSVKLSIQYGNTSSFRLCLRLLWHHCLYSFARCRDRGKIWEFSHPDCRQFDAKTVKPEVNNAAGLFIFHRKYHLSTVIDILQESYTGD
jgi:predicted ATPase